MESVAAGCKRGRPIPKACARGALKVCAKGDSPLFNVVIFLVLLTIALLALIYWGGFKEESRNS